MRETDDGTVLEDEGELGRKSGLGKKSAQGRLEITELGDVGVEVGLGVVSRLKSCFDVDGVSVEQKAELFPAKTFKFKRLKKSL